MVAFADDCSGRVDLIALTADAEDADDVEVARCGLADPPASVLEASTDDSETARQLEYHKPCTSKSQNDRSLQSILATSSDRRARDLPSEKIDWIVVPYVIGGLATDDVFESCGCSPGVKVGGVRTREHEDSEDEEVGAQGSTPPTQDDDKPTASIQLNLRQLLSATGGRVWDSSLVFSAWLAEGGCDRLPLPLNGAGKVLELGAGLGVLGLAVAQVLQGSGTKLVMSDYDVEVLDRLSQNIKLNFASRPSDEQPSLAMIDFRDFEPAKLKDAGVQERYSEHFAAYDCILAADIVYQNSHAQLSLVIDALLRPETDGRPIPCAMLVLPDSRPSLQAFVDFAATTAGGSMHVTCARIANDCGLMKRLRRARQGLGANQSFSLYTLTRCR
eukprot:TRINITY_DN44418_c0_g1_i1.p1 TRINITY_DN44418_c0_g1~~TRINITY_DN44418_c0_g1_i1.p1  ORF type:complete len:437 (+),score=67.77 TRINITY_DN44418_c0_g1_i1:148-1311(+)